MDERHESKVPVQLPGAIKKCRAWVAWHEVNFQLLARTDGHDVFENARGRCAGYSHDLQLLALQMQRQALVTGVADSQSVASAAPQVEQGTRLGRREAHAVDGPTVEAAARRIVSGQHHLESRVG